MIKKIIFIGDLLRTEPHAYYFADRSLKWEYYNLKEQIKLATSFEPELALGADKNIFDREYFYKLCGYNEITTENWLTIACGNYTKEAVDYFAKCFKDCLLITQVGGALKQFMDLTQVQYIDIYVSALKFMDDIHFAFRTNNPDIRKELKRYRIDESVLYLYANRLKAYYSTREWQQRLGNIEADSLLLCGQSDVDLSLVKNGKIINFGDFKDEITELIKRYPNVYYKPHPYSTSSHPNEIFLNNFKNIKKISGNFYEMISNDNIAAVAALSSGTLVEAKYFGKKTHTISHNFVNYDWADGNNDNDFILINNDYFSPSFWADILSPILETMQCINFSFDNKTNVLRNSLDCYWDWEINNPKIQNNYIQYVKHELEVRILNIENELKQIKVPKKKHFLKVIRQLLSCLIPIKSLRKKIREGK